MQINELRIQNFRNFSQLSFLPQDHLNIIHGANGAGKTSILEALHILGFGRSFRTNKIDNIIKHDVKSPSSVFARYVDEFQNNKTIGFSRSRAEGFVFNNDGAKTSRISDVARLVPCQIFTPQSSDLVLGAPLNRRRYIDWLVFHVEHHFQKVSSTYSKALSQRNSLLKTFSVKQNKESFKEQDVWLKYLVDYGSQIDTLRKMYVELLGQELSLLYKEFNSELEIEIRYNSGWERDSTLEEALLTKTPKDLLYGYTSIGPHKADLQFFVDSKNAAEFLSRGQLRVMVSLLLMAEVSLLKKCINKSAIFLIDDIGAELDEITRGFFLNKALETGSQLFVTAIEKDQLTTLKNYKNKKMFHVEHNHVTEE